MGSNPNGGGGTLSIKTFGLTASSQNVSYSLVNIFTVHATTNNRHTMKLEDVPAGKVIRVGNKTFVAVGNNTYQSSAVGSLECGEHSSNDPVNDFLCVCDAGYFVNAAGGTAYDYAGGSCSFQKCSGSNTTGTYVSNNTCTCSSGFYSDTSGATTVTGVTAACSYKKCGSGTTGTYVDVTNGTCTCSTDKFANSSGATTVAIATGTCTYNKYCTGSGVTNVYATSAPSSCTCASGKFSSTTGGTTTSTSGTCTYNKYCTGSGVTNVFATSAPSSCTCASGKYSSNVGATTTTTSGSCSYTACASGKYADSSGHAYSTGTCTYNQYCTGSNVTNVFATSAPSSCTCNSGYYGNSDGTTSTTTTSGSCVACATNTAYNSTAKRCIATTMQAFTAAMCNAFATPSSATGYTTVGTLKDTRNNKSYVIRKFKDGKCWMAQNLAYGTVSNASTYSSNSGKSASGILGSGLYGVAISPGAGYEGYLYNWQAAMQRSDAYYGVAYSGPSLVQGICPTGWHVPTGGDAGELKALSDATGTNAAFFFGGNFCASGSSCVAGIAIIDGSLYDQGSNILVWSSSPLSATNTSTSHRLYADSGKVNPASYDARCGGFSVRCVRD